MPETLQQPSSTPHLPRYKRAGSHTFPLRVQPRDLALLKLVSELPYCDAKQLSRLLPVGTINAQLHAYHDRRREERVRTDNGLGNVPVIRRVIRRRLQKLFHGGYMQRHKVTDNAPILYTIAMPAVDLLAAHYDLDAAALARSARSRDPGDKYLEHARMRTTFRYSLAVGLPASPDAAIAFWYKDGSVKIPVAYHMPDGKIVQETVIPDDFIGIRWHGVVEPFFVETDKRKDYPRVRKKFLAYLHLWRQIVQREKAQGHQRSVPVIRQARPPVATIAGQPVRNVRVLWIAKGPERAAGLRRLARELDSPQEKASGLFWFTDESQYLDAPERVCEAIWQKARNDTWRPLLA